MIEKIKIFFIFENFMKIAILSNIFDSNSENKEVEDGLTQVGKKTKEALESFGHEVTFYDVNERVFEKLRKAKPDAAFNVCERFNGSSLFEPHVASMLELLNIPYTGSGPLALATCLNKPMVKAVLMHHEISTPKYQVFYSRWRKLDPELKFPLIVKPCSMDNSIGISPESVVKNEDELRHQINYILKTYSQPALAEEFIAGREFTVSILGNDKEAEALPVCEIIMENIPNNPNKIYSYDAKWDENGVSYNQTNMECPAKIPKYLELKLQKIALEVHRVLGVRDYSRVDLRLDAENNPYVLEMNPNPGISADCFLPYSASILNISYNQLINIIFCCALERHGIQNDKEISHVTDVIKEEAAEKIETAEIKIASPLKVLATQTV